MQVWSTLSSFGTRAVIENAEYYANCLGGLGWSSKHADLHIISDTSHLGANNPTSGGTCLAYCYTMLGHGYGYKQLFGL